MASQNISLLTLSLTASGAVAQHRFVDATGATATAAGHAVGVSRTAAADGEVFPADAVGTAIVEAAGAVAKGDAIEVGANGQAAVQSAGVTVARALQAAASAGDLIEVLLIQN